MHIKIRQALLAESSVLVVAEFDQAMRYEGIVCYDDNTKREDKMTAQLDAQKVYGELSQLREEIRHLRNQVHKLEQVVRPAVRTEHPHIVRIEGVHGGRPTIRGTGVSVQTVVEQVQLGQSPQQIVEDFDGVLTLAQVHDALSYYYEHEKEIEQDINENREALWKGPKTTSSS